MTLLEPIKKRAAFLADALTELGLDGEIVAARAEDARATRRTASDSPTATARAVAAAPTVAELTVPFLAVGGRALLQRGSLETAERNAVPTPRSSLVRNWSRSVRSTASAAS